MTEERSSVAGRRIVAAHWQKPFQRNELSSWQTKSAISICYSEWDFCAGSNWALPQKRVLILYYRSEFRALKCKYERS